MVQFDTTVFLCLCRYPVLPVYAKQYWFEHLQNLHSLWHAGRGWIWWDWVRRVLPHHMYPHFNQGEWSVIILFNHGVEGDIIAVSLLIDWGVEGDMIAVALLIDWGVEGDMIVVSLLIDWGKGRVEGDMFFYVPCFSRPTRFKLINLRWHISNRDSTKHGDNICHP